MFNPVATVSNSLYGKEKIPREVYGIENRPNVSGARWNGVFTEKEMADHKGLSPRILSFGWGKMEVEGLGRGRDFKLWPGGGRVWDWSEFGTDHQGGIQPGELDELLRRGCRVVVFTRGRLNRLKVAETTLVFARNRGLETIVASTARAIKIYNEYVAQGLAVGGLFHSTC